MWGDKGLSRDIILNNHLTYEAQFVCITDNVACVSLLWQLKGKKTSTCSSFCLLSHYVIWSALVVAFSMHVLVLRRLNPPSLCARLHPSNLNVVPICNLCFPAYSEMVLTTQPIWLRGYGWTTSNDTRPTDIMGHHRPDEGRMLWTWYMGSLDGLSSAEATVGSPFSQDLNY